MSLCCIAAATATAVLTAALAVGLTAFVPAADGPGVGLLLGTAPAAVLPRQGLIDPRPPRLYGLSLLPAARAAWLPAAPRRPLLI